VRTGPGGGVNQLQTKVTIKIARGGGLARVVQGRKRLSNGKR